jgi:hypothetical protein
MRYSLLPEELNRCAVVFSHPPGLVEINDPLTLFNPDFYWRLLIQSDLNTISFAIPSA